MSANTVGHGLGTHLVPHRGVLDLDGVAYDANDKQVGTTSSTFSVDSQIQAVQAPAIESPEGTGVGKTLTSRPPQWNVAGVETTYQWLVDGQAPWSATGTTYTITANDYGKSDHPAGDRQEGRLPRRDVHQLVADGDVGRLRQQPDPTHHLGVTHRRQLPDRQPGHVVRQLHHQRAVDA